MENEIKVERKLTSLGKQLLKAYKEGHYMLFWVGKYRRRFRFKKPARYKETLLWFTNYFEFGGKKNE